MTLPASPCGALHAPHTLRNRDPILAVLRCVLADQSAVLECACGSGEQGPYFAAALPHLEWQASDVEPAAVASAAAWAEAARLPNLRPPIGLDVTARTWPLPADFEPDALVAINMIHIAPYAACEGLFAGAAGLLPACGIVYLYGPYKVNGVHTSESNAAFDRSLRERDPSWGIRDLEQVATTAADHGFVHAETVAMPANNHSVVFRKA